MNRYTLRLKDLLWALGTFEYVKVAEDFVGSIENDEDYKFLRETDYAVVDIMTFGDEKYGAMLRISVEEFDE